MASVAQEAMATMDRWASRVEWIGWGNWLSAIGKCARSTTNTKTTWEVSTSHTCVLAASWDSEPQAGLSNPTWKLFCHYPDVSAQGDRTSIGHVLLQSESRNHSVIFFILPFLQGAEGSDQWSFLPYVILTAILWGRLGRERLAQNYPADFMDLQLSSALPSADTPF